MTDQTGPDRRADALRRAELAASSRRAEADRARVLVDAFVVRARQAGLAPERLMATQLDGRVVKTDKTGWYVNKKRSIGIGEDGGWYVLTVPSSALARFTGVRLEASDPELVVGRGGRDGESGDLSEFLDRLFENL